MKCFLQSIYTLIFFLGAPLAALANGEVEDEHVEETTAGVVAIDPLVLGVGVVVIGVALLWFFVLRKK